MPDTPVLNVLAQLVFGETGPLYEELVLKEQKVVQLFGSADSSRDPGLFEVLVLVRKSEDLPLVRGICEGAWAGISMRRTRFSMTGRDLASSSAIRARSRRHCPPSAPARDRNPAPCRAPRILHVDVAAEGAGKPDAIDLLDAETIHEKRDSA